MLRFNKIVTYLNITEIIDHIGCENFEWEQLYCCVIQLFYVGIKKGWYKVHLL